MNAAHNHSAGKRESDNTMSHSGHGGKQRWMMIACCIPMIVIAIALVATGAVSASFLIFVAACTAMMALMMGGMSHGGK